MRKLLFATILTIFTVLYSIASNNLQPWQKAAIATRFASEVKYNFAGYGKFAQDYDSICRAELPNLVNTQSDEEFSENQSATSSGDMDLSKLRQFQLTSDTDIKPFKCADNDLNEFLFDDAKHFQKELMAVTYLLEYMEQNKTAAYFSLLDDKITFNPDEKAFGTNLTETYPIQNVVEAIRRLR